jgi:glycosyltransferase involved in cell wall biosynthesis
MNVLYFLGQFPKLSESFIVNEIHELRHRGHNVAVFALDRPEGDVTHHEYDELDIPVRYAESPAPREFTDIVSPTILNRQVIRDALFRASPGRHALAFHRARQCIGFIDELPFDVDIVHTHFLRMRMYPARYVATFLGVPQTATIHAFEMYENPNIEHFKHFINRADHIFTISEYNRQYIQENITNSTPVSVVHAGIRPEKFDPSGNTVEGRILTVARFVEKKGLCHAIEAVGQLENNVSVEYHVIGSGPLKADLEQSINEHGLSDVVQVRTRVTDEGLITEYDEAACFLLPCVVAESGDRDGIPVVLMESMAMQTPPVSTTVSGIPELINDGENGILVPPRDTDELAERLEWLLRHPEKRDEFGIKGRKKVEREFDIATEVRKLEQVFADLTGTVQARTPTRLEQRSDN